LANPEHVAKLKAGVGARQEWGEWRKQNPGVRPDLRHANLDEQDLRKFDLVDADFREASLRSAELMQTNLSGADLSGADLFKAILFRATLKGANLSEADLSGANFGDADLRGASLSWANFGEADLRGADLSGANLSRANLSEANLNRANLSEADLSGADLSGAILIETNLTGANLTACAVYGISVWNVRLEGANQSNLVIDSGFEFPIHLDNLEVAQFIYLLLNNERIRSVIDTITSKLVLILGRFTPGRKVVLDAIRDELRKRGYLPVLFDFEKPTSKDLTGTISTLANMARFIIADLTDPSSVPHELAMVVPGTIVPVQTIILEEQREYAMFVDLKSRYHWVLEPHQYRSQELLIAQLSERVIAPAENKAKDLVRKM
jgi:uncharacterized protein YjbI with pentapeptide repeats